MLMSAFTTHVWNGFFWRSYQYRPLFHLKFWHASDTTHRQHVWFFNDYRPKRYWLLYIMLKEKTTADRYFSQRFQSNYHKLAECSYRKSLEKRKKEIRVYSYYIYTYVSMSAMYDDEEKPNQITFRQHTYKNETCRFNYSVYIKTIIFTTTDYLNQHTGQP
jgi:hypothetical protein